MTKKEKKWVFVTTPLKKRDVERLDQTQKLLLPLKIIVPKNVLVASALLKLSRLKEEEILSLVEEIKKERAKES